jgi:uncharacterized membrane protein
MLLPSGGTDDRCYRRACGRLSSPITSPCLELDRAVSVSGFFAATIFRRPLAADRGFVLARVLFGISELLFRLWTAWRRHDRNPAEAIWRWRAGEEMKKNDQALAMRLIMLAGFRNMLGSYA